MLGQWPLFEPEFPSSIFKYVEALLREEEIAFSLQNDVIYTRYTIVFQLRRTIDANN